MKMSKRKIFFVCVGLALLCSCETDTYDDTAIIKPNGNLASAEELSAGISTIFMSSPKAYDQPADWITSDNTLRFNSGDKLYDDSRTSSEGEGGGLGPVYAGYSCGSCHKNAGRTKPTLYSDGGSGAYGFSSMLVYISRKNGAFFKQYGRVLHDQSIYGVQAEGKLKVNYTEKSYTFADGEAYSLQTPHYEIT